MQNYTVAMTRRYLKTWVEPTSRNDVCIKWAIADIGQYQNSSV